MKKFLIFLTVFAVIAGFGISSNVFAQSGNNNDAVLKQIERLMEMVKGLQSQKDNSGKNNSGTKATSQVNTTTLQTTPPKEIIVPKPGKMHLSIQELGNGRNEVNIKNAIITEISTSATIVCITTPCNQPLNITVKIAGLTFKVIANPSSEILRESREKSNPSEFKVGDYVNIYGTQDQTNPSVIDAKIVRNVSLVKRIIEARKNEKPKLCIQVITKAQNPQTGEIKEFSTPCDVPQGWVIVPTVNSTSTTPTATTTNSTSTNQ